MFDPQPDDRYRCLGCGQLLLFDATLLVADEQLMACEGRCDWLLVQRAGKPVRPDPGPHALP